MAEYFGYCRQHFDALPADVAISAATRSKAKAILRKSATSVAGGASVAEVVREISDVAGTFLTPDERRLLEVLGKSTQASERAEAAKALSRSLAQG